MSDDVREKKFAAVSLQIARLDGMMSRSRCDGGLRDSNVHTGQPSRFERCA